MGSGPRIWSCCAEDGICYEAESGTGEGDRGSQAPVGGGGRNRRGAESETCLHTRTDANIVFYTVVELLALLGIRIVYEMCFRPCVQKDVLFVLGYVICAHGQSVSKYRRRLTQGGFLPTVCFAVCLPVQSHCETNAKSNRIN